VSALNQKELSLFYSYCLNNLQQLEDEVYNLQVRIRFRAVTVTDLVELICAQQRLETFKEVTEHIKILLNM